MSYYFKSEGALINGDISVESFTYEARTVEALPNSVTVTPRQINFKGKIFTANEVEAFMYMPFVGEYPTVVTASEHAGYYQHIGSAGWTPEYRAMIGDNFAYIFTIGNRLPIGDERTPDYICLNIVTGDLSTPLDKEWSQIGETMPTAGGIQIDNNLRIGIATLNVNGIEYLCSISAYRQSDSETRWRETLHFKGYRISDYNQFGEFLKEEDPDYGKFSDEGGYGGGAGSFDASSDVIGMPDIPSISVSNIGFVNVYNPSVNGLVGLIDEVFPEPEHIEFPTSPGLDDVADCVVSVGKAIVEMVKSTANASLMHNILDAHIIPVSPARGSQQAIKVGWKTTAIGAPKVTTDYIDFNCGTLNISEYYQNFIDYAGTSAQLYLPAVGFVPIKPEYFQNGKLKVVYRFNVLDGSFVAFVFSSSSKSNLRDSIIGTYTGSCCVHIPIAAQDYSNVISGLVGGAQSTVQSAIGGNVAGAVQGAMQMVSAKPQLMMSNGYNGTSAFCGLRYPYLLISRQVSAFSKSYPSENGLPLNVTHKLSAIEGYSEIEDIILDGINADYEEKQQLKELLASGVIL